MGWMSFPTRTMLKAGRRTKALWNKFVDKLVTPFAYTVYGSIY